MIQLVKGDIFSSKCQALVNPVNCEGVMGKGLAKAFKDRWPEMFREYQAACMKKEVQIGRPTIWRGLDKWVINFPTKDSWRRASKIEYIDQGLVALKSNLKEWGVGSLAMPALGCGLGGLEWSKVKLLVSSHFGNESIPIEVYEP